MNYRIWYSTESFADYIIAKTNLNFKDVQKKKLYESDANNTRQFHTMPDHIKQILYLDSPDLIVEIDSEPIFSIEISTEAGSGHNVFQRFPRLVASVENDVPSFYIYPEAKIIDREQSTRWDKINPQIFKALDDVMSIYNIPALFYYFPSDFKTHTLASLSPNYTNQKSGLRYDNNKNFRDNPDSTDSEMIKMFSSINEILTCVEKFGAVAGRHKLMSNRIIMERRTYMQKEYSKKVGNRIWSPLTATIEIPTSYLLNYLSAYETNGYVIGELLKSRETTILYQADSRDFRSDPYCGCISAIDYLKCRQGKSFEERRYNLIAIFGKVTIDNENHTLMITTEKNSSIKNITNSVFRSESRNLLSRDFSELENHEIPRYYMQMRYGSMFSKAKEVRIFSYFADAILFPDGALWRDA
jgi:hypothetical protein